MKRRNKTENKNNALIVSEIRINSDEKPTTVPNGNIINHIHDKGKNLLCKKRERGKYSQKHFSLKNNDIPIINQNYMTQFNTKGVFKSYEHFKFPIMNNYFDYFYQNPVNKQTQVTLIINNYINIDKSNEEIGTVENTPSIVHNSQISYFESPSTTSSKSNQIISKLQEKSSQKNKFNVIKGILDENNQKTIKFNLSKKRGRKAIKIGKRQHSALDQDNIIRKIQVHFISFIIDFTNDIIQTVTQNNKNMFFKSINYEYKKTVNHSYIQNLFSKNIGEIVQLKASPKNKKFDKDINKIIYEKLCNIEIFKKLFEISYLEIFNQFYYQENREIDVFGVKVKLSQRTKLFADLLEKNKTSIEKIKEIAEEIFVNKKKDSSKIFVIQKKDFQSKQ